jgi:hypothetical protein
MSDAPPTEPASIDELQAAFMESYGKIEGHARRKFNYLHGDDLDEAVAETVALAWAAYHRLFIQGRAIEGKRGGVAIFSAKSVAFGSQLVGQHPVNDVMSPAGRAGHCLGPPREDEWVDDESPAALATFRVDLEEWLSGLDDRPRAVAEQLLSGLNTVEVARLQGVSRMMIYFIRQDLWEAYEELFGEGSTR